MAGKHTDGLGSVTHMSDGRWRARGPRQPDGTRPSLGIHATKEEAERAVLLGAVELRESKKAPPKNTLESLGEEILEERELVTGIRDPRNEKSRFKNHIVPSLLGKMDPRQVTPVHVAAWIRWMMLRKTQHRFLPPQPLDRATIARTLSLLSAILDALGPQGRGLITSNPVLGMKVPKRAGKEATREKSTWLTVPEQEWFALPRVTSHGYVCEHERLAILFACSGIRFGEQFNLELSDLHEDDADPYATIRFGSDGGPRKNAQIYEAGLFGYALMAAKAWRKLLPKFCPHNPQKLVWPTESGCRRSRPLGNGHFRPVEAGQRGTHVIVKGKPKRAAKGGTHVYVDRFHEAIRIAGITRRVRWHDMRHTTGTSLVSGAWGAPWSLEEVRVQFDHSTVAVTQRYAKFMPEVRKRAARKVTVGAPGSVGHSLDTPSNEETTSKA